MTATAIYIIKVIAISSILYGYFFLTMRNINNHSWSRFFLLSIFIVSLAVPFLQMPNLFRQSNPLYAVSEAILVYGASEINVVTIEQPKNISNTTVVICTYLFVCTIFLISLMMSFLRMIKLWRTSEQVNISNSTLLYTNDKRAPFSFFNLIFWKREIDPESELGNKILLHELTHVRQWHSLDRLLVNIVMIFAWVNPVFWLVRRDLYMVHEFAADESSTEQDPDILARVLLTTAFPAQYQNMTSHFYSSSIKRRLKMLTKKQKTQFGYLGRLLTLPLVLFVLAAFSINNKASMQQVYIADSGYSQSIFSWGRQGLD